MWLILLEEFIGDLRTQKLRAFLTSMAVIWGTIAVVLLLSFGEGLRVAVVAGLENNGDRMFFVWGGETEKIYQGLPKGRYIPLTEEDLELVKRSIPQIDLVSPSYGNRPTFERGTVKTVQYMEGVSPDFEALRHMYPVAGGRFLDMMDVKERRRVVFLGDSLAIRLFGKENPVGQQILVNRLPFTVVGVMQKKLQTSMNEGPDAYRAIIPSSTFKAIYGTRRVEHLLIRPRTLGESSYVKARIYQVLGRKHQFDPTDKRALGVWDTVEDGKENRMIGLGIQIFMGIVGALTLLLAGVGVANIMYVVVKERTREIGVKLALGARKGQITAQFVFEALLLCFSGGAIGLLFSALVVAVVSSVPRTSMAMEFIMDPILSWPIALTTAGILTGLGLLSGWFPARRAASVDPVESLRYE